MKNWVKTTKIGQKVTFSRLFTVLLLLLCALSGAAVAQGGPESALVVRAAKGVVQINSLGGTQHLGTGFVYAENGQILTAYSQIAGRNRFEIRMSEGPSEVATPVFFAELRSYNVMHDLAVLQVYADLSGSLLDGAALARVLRSRQAVAPGVMMASEADVPAMGDGVGVLGFPTQGEGLLMYTNGVISGVQRGEVSGRVSLFRIHTTAVVAPGAAGGVLLDRRGRVAGLALASGGEEGWAGVFSQVLPMAAVRTLLSSSDMTPHTFDRSLPEVERLNEFDFTQLPNYGVVELSAGFLPDPHDLPAIAGGTITADHLSNACVGYASAAPDFRLIWSGTTENLNLSFITNDDSGDATLIVRGPDGTWFCNDDSEFGGFNPLVNLTAPLEGQYDIWIGTYSQTDYINGTLRISEVYSASLVGQVLGETLDPSLDASYGVLDLAAGFRNDPASLQGTAGGPNDITDTMPELSCFGHFGTAPDFRVQWTGSTAGLRMFFEAEEEGQDAVILINTPSGEWLCNDDGHEFTVNPMLDLNGQGEGEYTIWIGSYGMGEFIDGLFSVTTTGKLPR